MIIISIIIYFIVGGEMHQLHLYLCLMAMMSSSVIYAEVNTDLDHTEAQKKKVN